MKLLTLQLLRYTSTATAALLSTSGSSKMVPKQPLTCMKLARRPLSSASAILVNEVPVKLLASAWAPQLLSLEEQPKSNPSQQHHHHHHHHHHHLTSLAKASERTLPLLAEGGGAEAIPFVCRYRTDVIDPLTTQQVHQLSSLLAQHASLKNLRTKLVQALERQRAKDSVVVVDANNTSIQTVLTTTSKAELEDWYAPFKPPSKGSILDRIQKEHPELVEAVDQLWQQTTNLDKDISWIVDFIQKRRYQKDEKKKDALIHLVASKIAADPTITRILAEEMEKYCRVQTKMVHPRDTQKEGLQPGSKNKKPKLSHGKTPGASQRQQEQQQKYTHYDGFQGHLNYLKDHQVLAIRRGVDQKHLSLSYEIDGTKMESCLWYHMRSKKLAPNILLESREGTTLLKMGLHDAWSRLLRRRGTSRLWTSKCKQAQERALQVFSDNLQRALLSPPYDPPSPILALDPGFQAGIKCAILEKDGSPQRLDTIQFLGNKREEGVSKLSKLMQETASLSKGSKGTLVAMGNGHGSQDCRGLVEEAMSRVGLRVTIKLVNEAGASVWSVTETAKREFPEEKPAAIAAISIGRRLQNPLFELVKVPPRSLGLGMYQHDLTEKETDERLHVASVDAVATVGVDVNSCSLEIMEKVPGLSKLASKILAKRPLHRRSDLLKVSGLGPKTYENCAAFCRVISSTSGSSSESEPLDATLVHPESYDVARFLMKRLSWELDTRIDNLPSREDWPESFAEVLQEASSKFGLGQERLLAILENLVNSIMNIDPRMKGLKSGTGRQDPLVDSLKDTSILSANLSDLKKLAEVTPYRGVTGAVRNVSDFGAFIDFGGHNDGLLHVSNLGKGVKLEDLMIGQQIGVDILAVEGSRVSLGIHGLNSVASVANTKRRPQVAKPNRKRKQR